MCSSIRTIKRWLRRRYGLVAFAVFAGFLISATDSSVAAHSDVQEQLFLPGVLTGREDRLPASTATPLPPVVSPTPTPVPSATPTNGSKPEVRVGSGTVVQDSELVIPVDLLNLQAGLALGFANIEIVYDSVVVNANGCTPGPDTGFDQVQCNVDSSGVVHIDASSASRTTGDPVRLALITFEPVGQIGASSSLTPAVAVLEDPEGKPISGNSTGGLITIVENQTVGPAIGSISTNLDEYAGNQVPRYEKLELTFDVDTTAQKLQLPFDALPPPGVEPEIGITVDALFSPDNWQTVYRQPAFYYQEFFHEIRSGQEWLYPTDDFSWKVRFAPDQEGDWQYKIVATDASGTSETAPQSFVTRASDNKGFIRVSETDPRYFEYEDGTYFPALGYNMNYDHVGWVNPVLDNKTNFQIMGQNGIQLARIWLSQWAIYGSEWNPWMAQNPKLHGLYLPYTGVTPDTAFPGSDFSMQIDANHNPCMFIGVWKAKPATRQDTDYRFQVRYKSSEITGPRLSGHTYGFTAKTGGWLWDEGKYCQDPGAGTLLTTHQTDDTDGWKILEGTLNSGDNDFLPNFFLVLENADAGTVYVDYVWIQEDLGNGQYGPNIISKPWMAHHLYMEQRNSYAFDQVVELAEQNGIYLRPVIHEKNDRIFTRIDFDGDTIRQDDRCTDQDPDNDPDRCPGNKWFYGNWRQMTKVRWLQQAWWRYLQARWGYSPNIHSWELLNEGDPWNGQHYTLADEFGKYMRQFQPNHHMVSTSNWHSFPRDPFWANAAYSNVDFADIHQYIPESDAGFTDAAQATYAASVQYGAKQPGGAGKPVIRGETSFVVSGSGPAAAELSEDTQGIWLHNFIWGGINAGGLIESYWYENRHIYTDDFDHRHHFGAYYNFIKDVPLSNGHYQDAQAAVSNSNLRAWGQTDLTSGRAHLWIQNKNHTWKNVVDGVSVPAISGTLTVPGFQPGASHKIEWWDPYQPEETDQIIGTKTVTAQTDGSIRVQIDNLDDDVAIKISRS